MLKEERQQIILQILNENGKVVATELSRDLGVSEDTIRRDLDELAQKGTLQRVHGGGLPHSPAMAGYRQRMEQNPELKSKIASAVIKHLSAGQVIFLDGGTTNLFAARLIPPDFSGTLITNSPAIASTLCAIPAAEVICVGGKLDQEQQVVTGAVAENFIRSLRVDILLLGVCSIHPRAGITVPELEEASLKRLLIDKADRVIALVTADKLGTAAAFQVAPLNSLHLLITNQTSSIDLSPYSESGVEIELV